MADGGNSHQRKIARKAHEKLADPADKVTQSKSDRSPKATTTDHPVVTHPVPFRIFNGFAVPRQSALWLLERVWSWPVVGAIAAIGVPLAFFLAQEHMYTISRVLLALAGALVFLKTCHDAAKSSKSNEVKLAVTVISFVVMVIVIAGVAGGFWIIRAMEKSYVDNLPRADLHVDNVTIEIESLGLPGKKYPVGLIAHINGHNASSSVPTAPYPIVKASISARPFITQAEQEEDLFRHGKWANETYLGFPYVLNPSQTFSFSKRDSFSVLDARGFRILETSFSITGTRCSEATLCCTLLRDRYTATNGGQYRK